MIKQILVLSLPLLILSGCGNDNSANGPQAVSLGPITGGPATGALDEASGYTILASDGITNIPPSVITGNIGISPEPEASMTAFAFTAHPSGQYSTSAQIVNGGAYAANKSAPTPANLTAAIGSMEAAYTDAAGRTNPTATELEGGDLSGLTIAPGLYKWGTGVIINSPGLTLAGGPNDTWIFQISQGLTMAANIQITLAGGARPANIFWQTGTSVTVGANSVFQGVILAFTTITLGNGTALYGRAYAQTAVNMDANTVRITAP